MNENRGCRGPLPWGLAAVWILGLAAVLGTVAARVGRAVGHPPHGTSHAVPTVTTVLRPPSRNSRPRPSEARRVDTFPEILSVRQAIEVDSAWVVLDARSRRVAVVPDRTDAPILTFGREGDGPGEIRDAGYLAVSGEQVAVLESHGERLVRFDRAGSALGPVTLGVEGCPFGPGRALLADPEGGFLVLRSCTALDGVTRALLQRVWPDGRVERLADRPLQPSADRSFDPFSVPVAAVLEGHRFLGLLSQGCLRPLAEAQGIPALCAPEGSGLPLPDSVRTRLEALALRALRVGRRIEIPDRLPPFIEVRPSSAGPVLRVPLASGGEALDLVELSGDRVRFQVGTPDAVFIGRRDLLFVRDLAAGTELSWVPCDE